MSTTTLVIHDDDGISNNETSPLITHIQGAASLASRDARRHSVSWVNFFNIKEKQNKFNFLRTFRVVGVKLIE
jgi:hypothetical protein